MDDQSLENIYIDIYQTNFRGGKYPLTAQFYNSRALNHTIRIKNGEIKIRIAEKLKTAPSHILSTLGLILLLKLFRVKVDRELTSIYRKYIRENILPDYKPALRKPSALYSPIGKYFNLDDLFDKLNYRFFENRLENPQLGWSLNKSYSRLGFYTAEKNLLVISRIFDSKKVPQEVVEFLLYHEMLHIYIPVGTGKKRRIIHPPEFRRLERSFPNYERIEKWITKKRRRL